MVSNKKIIFLTLLMAIGLGLGYFVGSGQKGLLQFNSFGSDSSMERDVSSSLKSGGDVPKSLSPVISSDASIQAAENDAEKMRAKERGRIFDYSRSGNYSDTRDFLLKALNDGKISEKEYFGELGHMLSIEVKDPLSIIKEIVNSKNEYGLTVMYHALSSNVFLPQDMSRDERTEAYDLISSSQPKLNGGIHELGLFDAFDYENWMLTLRNMSADKFRETFNANIASGLKDPREYPVILYAMRNEGFPEINQESVLRINEVVALYRNSYPGNSGVEALMSDIK